MTAFLAQIIAKLNSMVKTFLDPIKVKVDALANTDLSTVQADLTTLKGDTGTLKGDTTTLKADTGTLKGDTTTLKADTGTLKSEATQIKADIATRLADIKYVQRTVTTMSTGESTLDVTLGATVNVNKSMLALLGIRGTLSTSASELGVTLELKNTTTVTLTRYTSASVVYVSWQIVEFN